MLLTYQIPLAIIVAKATVAGATIIDLRFSMSKFMKMLNNISRSQAIYRHSKISADDLQSCHYAFVLTICREPGRSQEEIAKELCVNKSTVTRHLNYLEEADYIIRTPLPNDKRQFSVFPSEKMQKVLPEIKAASRDWMTLISEGIAQDELAIFDSVLCRMEEKARELIEKEEDNK